MNVIFSGYRGSGKTTISKRLFQKIGWERIEVDNEIEKYFGLSIPEIIEENGWERFRMIEKKILKNCIFIENKIIDLGGGAILHEKIIEKLKENSFVIFLDCSRDILIERIKNDFYRPSLTNLSFENEINITLNKRLPLYKKYSDLIINTGLLTIDKCCDLVIFYMRNYRIMKKQYDNDFSTSYAYV